MPPTAAGEEAEVADAVDFDVIVLHQLAERIKRIAGRRAEPSKATPVLRVAVNAMVADPVQLFAVP